MAQIGHVVNSAVMLEYVTDPAFTGGAIRVLFWLAMAGLIAIIYRLVPPKVRRILSHRLF